MATHTDNPETTPATVQPPDRPDDPRVPPVGSVTQAERMFRVNWISNEWLEGDVPLLSGDFVSRQGRDVRILDIRPREDLTGALGYIPGSHWVAMEGLDAAVAALPRDTPLVLVSRSGGRSGAAVRQLREKGFRFVAAMQGGIWAWRDLGFGVSRDPAIFQRPGVQPVEFRTEAAGGHASTEDVEAHLGDPSSTRWLKLAALLVYGRVSCVDGRDGSGVLGTPGGDAGEFMLMLAAYEAVTGRRLNTAEVQLLLARRVEEFGRFYAHTDVHASNALIQALRADRQMDAPLKNVFHALEWRRFLTAPPVELYDRLLDHMLEPASVGCGHLRLSMQRAAEYGTRPALVKDVLRAVYRRRWEDPVDMEVAVLPGGHAEGGVLSVFMDEGVHPFSRIPLISPSSGNRQFFVAHPQVAGFLRQQQVSFLRQQTDVAPMTTGDAEQLALQIHALGERQTAVTLATLAKGLPVYQLRFHRHGSVTVVPQGNIG